LKKLDKLTRIDALRGKSSNVQNALDILASENKAVSDSVNNNGKKVTKLTHMTFRDPHGISKVTPLCPEVNDVKIIYNVFEFNYDSNVDNCLVDLELFPKYRAGDLALTADLNCLNMLFVIQWRNIKLWGPSLKKLTLTEVEFLHPQTLNPFALQCRNLTEMIIINPSTISDELFVGRVPELAKEPFFNLKKLTFEADKFPRHVANFLIGRATSIEELNVILDGLNQDQFKELLRFLIDVPRPKLQKLGLYYSKFEASSEDEEIGIGSCLHECIQTNLSLTHLTVYVRVGTQKVKDDLNQLERSLKSINWDLNTRFEIVIPKTSAKKYY